MITIEKDNSNPVRALFGHEITHRIQELAPESYKAFRDAALADAAFLNEKIQAVRETGGQFQIDLSNETAMDELAADYAGRMIEDQGFLKRFILQQRRVAFWN